MPALRPRGHFRIDEGAELIAHHVEFGGESRGLRRRAAPGLRQQRRQAVPALLPSRTVSRTGESANRAQRAVGKIEVRRSDEFALAHGDTAGHLREVLVEQNVGDALLDLTECSGAGEPARPFLHAAQRFGVGRVPGQAVGAVLFPIEECAVELSIDSHFARDHRTDVAHQVFGRGHAVDEPIGKSIDGSIAYLFQKMMGA